MLHPFRKCSIWITTVIASTSQACIVAAMTKPPDLEALARRYVELWQDQMAAAAADPELTEALVRIMQVTGSGLAASTAMWQSFWTGTAQRSAGSQHKEGFHAHDGSRQTAWA